jgi:cellulose synthase/poly-beta-1,6-N-acetylglucosamine synthase-like glycosyltransferase
MKGYQILLDTTENESLITRARCISIARFLYKSDAEYFVFIDADIHFSPESLLRLVESGHEVSVACYPKKVIMWDQAEKEVLQNGTKPLERVSSSLVTNFKHAKSALVDGFTEVLDGPTGFMCIRRSAIEKMYKAYPELMCKNDHQNKDLENYCAIFDCMIDPVNRRYLSEDYAFCRRWQQIGGQIFADVTTVLGHIGNLRFTGKLKP